MFCGAVADVFTALEVRRKVCVAPLGLRALEVESVSRCAGISSRAPSRMRRRSQGEEVGCSMPDGGSIDVPFRTGIAWLRILLIAARRRRSKGRGCHCIGCRVEVDDQLGGSNGSRVRCWLVVCERGEYAEMREDCGDVRWVGGVVDSSIALMASSSSSRTPVVVAAKSAHFTSRFGPLTRAAGTARLKRISGGWTCDTRWHTTSDILLPNIGWSSIPITSGIAHSSLVFSSSAQGEQYM